MSGIGMEGRAGFLRAGGGIARRVRVPSVRDEKPTLRIATGPRNGIGVGGGAAPSIPPHPDRA